MAAISKNPVDLRLAQTYLPGFTCLARGTILILILGKFPLSIPLMMVICTAMYVDRAVRIEHIFDSNAVLCTLLATHAINVFRSDPENHQLFLQTGSAAESRSEE